MTATETDPGGDSVTDSGATGDEHLLTVDELAAATGTTVRTARYYAGLGLLPPPRKRGRVAYYTAAHRARLELIRALQEHGFTLSAIERYLARLPEDATAEDVTAQRVMLTAWTPTPTEMLTRAQVDERVGSPVAEADLELLVRLGALRPVGTEGYEVLSDLATAHRLVRLGLPVESLVEAEAAISRNMERLADELTEVLRSRVIGPFTRREHTDADTARFEEQLTALRELTMGAVVSGYQRAADEVIRRSLTR